MSAPRGLDIVVLGLSVTSSWGNGHATTYRALLRALADRGHRVLFLERDVPWYASSRDLAAPPFCQLALYSDLQQLRDQHARVVADADLVIQGSFVPDGRDVADWVLATARGRTAFYDIDTPVTVADLEEDRCQYLGRAQLPRFDLYLSFTGGPLLRRLETRFGAARARPLYCSFDQDSYFPELCARNWDLGYMGTYSADRQPALDALLLQAARRSPGLRAVVAGSMYPADVSWPANVARIDHLPPAQHRSFYCGQRFTLNLTRTDMKAAGYSPSVRLFEAAACGVPILSDAWEGLGAFFTPDKEILVVHSTTEVMRALTTITPQAADQMGRRARRRALAEHTAHNRAQALEGYFHEVPGRKTAAAAVAGGRTARLQNARVA